MKRVLQFLGILIVSLVLIYILGPKSPNPLLSNDLPSVSANIEMAETWSKATVVNVASDEVAQAGIIVPETSEMQFLKLVASDSEGKVLSENLYWIIKENDYKALNSLPVPEVVASIKPIAGNAENEYEITLKNTGKTIAFMLGLRIAGKDSQQEILPSYWSDNYFSLLPGEEKSVTVKTAISGQLEKPVFELKAFNINTYKSIDL